MSSFLRTKSDQNIQIAQNIINNGYYASSIHCAYYSCVQLMLHILRSHFRKTETEIAHESESATGRRHIWLIGLIADEYESLTNNTREARKLKTHLKELKGNRNDSDYGNIEITEDMARGSINLANSINSKLKSIFYI